MGNLDNIDLSARLAVNETFVFLIKKSGYGFT